MKAKRFRASEQGGRASEQGGRASEQGGREAVVRPYLSCTPARPLVVVVVVVVAVWSGVEEIEDS